MPALPWSEQSPVEPDRDYLVMASRLPLARYRDIPAFLRGTLAIRRQLATAEGLVGYALDARLLSKTFWTLSVWRDEQALRAFAAARPHSDVVRSTRPHMRPTTFVTWTEPSDEVPVSWQRARQRIAENSATASREPDHPAN